ncbi:putative lysine-specific demethylase JMJ16 isoform X1 [Ziziphus jujuba]|uniref:Lysine-specific demethylase JMJ16 isoform X1 n=1 Tax=Ziziphus jujuba TaxID=326968 RepID=A0A6P3ZCB8_ZIZJJ|nr:putative lysine-specific demethylase JMJ16 isoform X1 [Ziziphus jujuba]XP_024926292.3 putative lysine-specific demethylase JMJ16 isoform X1 [Ziziphus jujuba]
MGTELMRVCIKEDNDEFPPVPPGFESFTSFTLKRVEDENQASQNMVGCSASPSATELESLQMETSIDVNNVAKITRSLRRKPGINYGKYDCSSEDELDERINHSFARPRLPKGVVRGCSECHNCQKVAAKWRPEDDRRPDLQDAPVFYPTEEEFEDTLKYIASIRLKAESYGICRIVPPSSWKPPCALKEKKIWENSKFATRVQRVDKLQNRHSVKKTSVIHNQMRRKRRRSMRMGSDCVTGGKGPGGVGHQEAETFGFEPGPEFSLETFQIYADDFKTQYFRKNENVAGGNFTVLNEDWEPSVEDIEGEYWRMVEKPTEEIEVLYGADLETGVFGSGFPKSSSQDGSAAIEQYIKSGWNLNNFPRLSGSVLSYESSDISGVLVPWLYVGMCFSSFCWHVEDHHLYSLNYMHWGAPKLWYGVPGGDACKLEKAMRKHLPDLFEEQPDLLHKLVTQLSPSILKSDGVPVFRCVQNPGEFVLTFPRAYHAGFNCGFNCAEAVNVAPVDWLPHGQIAIELYCEQGRKTSISHDKLLLGAAREAVRAHWELNLLKNNTSNNLRWKDVCGKEGVLVKALKTRVEMERVRREFLCPSQALKMESNFDATSERECSICFFDLHLSAAGCHCSPDKFACLNHAKQLCPCAWGDKFFLFRYDITELNILIEALEGKLSAIYRWARLDLGLALSSYVKDNMQVVRHLHSSSESIPGEMSSHTSANSVKGPSVIEITKESCINSTGIIDQTSSEQKKTSPEAALPLRNTRTSSISRSSCETEMLNNTSEVKGGESIILTSNTRTPVCQLSEEDTTYMVEPVKGASVVKKTSVLKHDNIILLSDDEGDEPKVLVSDRIEDTSAAKWSEHSERLEAPVDKVSPCNYNKDTNLTTPVTDAAVMGEKGSSQVPDGERKSLSRSVHVKDEQCENGGHVGCNLRSHSLRSGSMGPESGRNIQDSSTTSNTSDLNNATLRNEPKHPHPCASGIFDGMIPNLSENARTFTGSPSSSSNNLDRYYRQKGPRIAKLVRRINCMVEPLEFGVVLSGKSWCNSQAIFPKGFRSRVRYMSVLDPTIMCYYVSEVLDIGRTGPLFMVSLEQFPSEIFVHGSATKCWEMVRERVNQEISRQHKLGRINLPPLQPPGSLDGFEMFGFTSPAIVQAIEAMDRNRVCSEYWDSRPYSRPQVQIPQTCRSKDSSGNSQAKSEQKDDIGGAFQNHHPLPVGTDTVLRGLFKKANLEELHTLYSILHGNSSAAGQRSVTQLLNEEIHTRQR